MGDLSLYIVVIAFPPQPPSPVMNWPGIHLGSPTPEPAVCAGQMSPPLWAPGPSLTQKNQASVYPTVKWRGAEAEAALSTALSWWSVGTKGNLEATQTFSERWRRLTCCVTSGRVLSGPVEAHLCYTRPGGGVALSSRSALLAKTSGPPARLPCHCRSRPSALTPTLEVAVRDPPRDGATASGISESVQLDSRSVYEPRCICPPGGARVPQTADWIP